MIALPSTPLDEAAMKHALKLVKSMFCCRQVLVDGKLEFIHTATASQAGGHIDLTVYLAGSPAPVPADRVTVPPHPE